MSNNWNDPNAPQGGEPWNQNPNQDWNQAKDPAQDGGAHQPQHGWDQTHQPENQPWAQSQSSAWDQPQQSANNAWDQPQQAHQNTWDQPQSAQNAWDQPQANPGGWDQPQQGYAAPGGYQPGPAGYPAAGVPMAGMGPGGLPLANWGKRALGYILDWLPFAVVSYVIGLATGASTTSTDPNSASFDYTATATDNLLGNLVNIAGILILSYVASKTGQTWGRKIMKTQLISETGEPISFGMNIVRYLAHFLDTIACCIGWLFPLWDKNRQTFADKIMKTYVLDVSQSGPINVKQ